MTERQQRTIRTLSRKGYGAAEIAVALGVHPRRVVGWLAKHLPGRRAGTPPLPETDSPHVLSRRHGGEARCLNYCRFFIKRPENLDVLIDGKPRALCPECPDRERCAQNPYAGTVAPFETPTRPSAEWML